MTFTGTVTAGDAALTYTWDFGDEGTASGVVVAFNAGRSLHGDADGHECVQSGLGVARPDRPTASGVFAIGHAVI